tara:strand:+ start:391 stop:1233 length:843 start_codon:yes stop_codon:yes gene_type:complete
MSIDAHVYDIMSEEQVRKVKDELVWLENNLETVGDGFWLDKTAEPKNTIEKYILSTYKKVIADSGIDESQVAGFEWWHHHAIREMDVIDIHFDCDEHKSTARNSTGMVTPLRGTVTYIEEPNQAPTVIFGIKQESESVSDISDNISNVAYSYPKKGRLLSFDGSYMHGVFPPKSPMIRMTLMYNIWQYRLPELADHSEDSDWPADKSRDACPYVADDIDLEVTISEKQKPVLDESNDYKIVDIYYNHKHFRATTHVPFVETKPENNFIEIECNNEVIKNV